MTARKSDTCTRPFTMLAIAAALTGAGVWTSVLAAEPVATNDAKSLYLKERANCETGNTAQDRATCMKEAGAALDDKKKGKLDNSGSPVVNATDRCNVLPAKDKADCLARIVGPQGPNQRVNTTGSVEGGGVIRETTTIIPGAAPAPTPAPAPMPMPAPAPASAP